MMGNVVEKPKFKWRQRKNVNFFLPRCEKNDALKFQTGTGISFQVGLIKFSSDLPYTLWQSYLAGLGLCIHPNL